MCFSDVIIWIFDLQSNLWPYDLRWWRYLWMIAKFFIVCCRKIFYVMYYGTCIRLKFVRCSTALVHIATAMANRINLFCFPLLSQCEHHNLLPWYPFFSLPLPSWMGIEPIHDGNGNNTKIMKIMPLPSQCELALKSKSFKCFVCCCFYQLSLSIFSKSESHFVWNGEEEVFT